jgi:hypothetical protein
MLPGTYVRSFPSDLKILERIHRQYLDHYLSAGGIVEPGYVAVGNLADLAAKLGQDRDLLVGRLRYHINRKYSYKDASGQETHLIVEEHGYYLVNFPLLVGLIANLREEKKRYRTSICLSVTATIVSVIGAFVAFATALRAYWTL